MSALLLLSLVACSSGKQTSVTATATSALASNLSHAPHICVRPPCNLLPPPVPYVQTATANNTQGDTTWLDNPLLNSNPAALIMVTQVQGNSPTPKAQVGVWYNTIIERWGIFRENGGDMPIGALFNVNPIPGANYALLQTATTSNSAVNYTEINSPIINDTPNAPLFVTPDYNPGGVGASWDNHPLGVIYLPDGHWAIYHRDGNIPMTIGATYNVQIGFGGAAGWTISQLSSGSGGSFPFGIPWYANDYQQKWLLFVTQTVRYDQTWGAGGIGITFVHEDCPGPATCPTPDPFLGSVSLINIPGFAPNVLYNVFAYRIVCPC